jgi:hypothetical protein
MKTFLISTALTVAMFGTQALAECHTIYVDGKPVVICPPPPPPPPGTGCGVFCRPAPTR